jgi:class 3 adenylate cyclase
MRVSERLQNTICRALSQSMDVQLMEELAARAIPGYDIYQRTGFPASIPIPRGDAARQIVRDMIQGGYLKQFAEVLIEVNHRGVMGRSVRVNLLPQVVKELEALGYVFKREYGVFVEDGSVRPTRSWGVLREGAVYEMSFLGIDIVGNTALVRRHSKQLVLQVFSGLREQFTAIVQKREGRVWSWAGDGGVAAFHFGNKNVQAVLAGMEMISELFLYNLLQCPFPQPLHVRMAAHGGPCQFLESFEDIRSDTLRRLRQVEAQAAIDSLVITPGVYSDMGNKLDSFFRPLRVSRHALLYTYKLSWE